MMQLNHDISHFIKLHNTIERIVNTKKIESLVTFAKRASTQKTNCIAKELDAVRKW